MAPVDSAADTPAPPPPEELVLAGEFPSATREQWAALVDGVLRKSGRIGTDAELGAGVDKLVRRTPEGIPVAPLYTQADVADLPPVGVPGKPPYVRGATTDGPAPDGWDVRQRHEGPDVHSIHEAVLADLENGVTSIWLATGDGAELPTVLDGVLLDLAPVALDTGGADTGAGAAYLDLAGKLSDPAALLGTLGLDPIGLRARTGVGPDVASVVPLAQRAAAEHPLVRPIVVDGLPVHAAGGADAQELGFTMAAGVAYLRALTDAGLDVATAARLLEFRYAATDEQFPTIAKLRAARRLWSRVLEASGACGVDGAEGQRQHAVSAPTMFTRRDPYVNLLRGTIAGFAAGVGGANAVTVAPFDAAVGASTPFSRRVARNTQALLIQEAHLARVVDPAGGGWLVESLTDALARAAWTFFQEVEAAGGAVVALDAGLVAARVAAVRAAREKAVATRRTPITGVSEFPDLAEQPVERAPRQAAPNGGLPVYRPAEPFENYRDRSDAVVAATGTRPTAFLATLGPLATYSARAAFTRNLLAAGGIDAVEAGPTESAEAVAVAWEQSGVPVAVLCSSDTLYAERGEATAAALRAAGARRILVAGRVDVPGIDGQLYAGCDALAVIDGIYVAGGSA